MQEPSINPRIRILGQACLRSTESSFCSAQVEYQPLRVANAAPSFCFKQRERPLVVGTAYGKRAHALNDQFRDLHPTLAIVAPGFEILPLQQHKQRWSLELTMATDCSGPFHCRKLLDLLPQLLGA